MRKHRAEVGSELAEKGRALGVGMGADAHHYTIAEYDVETKHALAHRAVQAGPEEDGALRNRAANGRAQAGQRPPERRAHAQRRQRVEQLFPGGAALDRYPAVVDIDVEHTIEPAEVKGDRVAPLADVAARVGHAAAPGQHGQAVAAGDSHHLGHLLRGARPGHRQRRRRFVVHVLRMEPPVLIAEQHLLRAQCRLQFGHGRGGRGAQACGFGHVGLRGHVARGHRLFGLGSGQTS